MAARKQGAVGAWVKYCGHNGCFTADIILVAGAAVVRANGPVTTQNLDRSGSVEPTHTLTDFPAAGFWRPDLGVFVVPAEQVKVYTGTYVDTQKLPRHAPDIPPLRRIDDIDVRKLEQRVRSRVTGKRT